jgi:uncharacterized protein
MSSTKILLSLPLLFVLLLGAQPGALHAQMATIVGNDRYIEVIGDGEMLVAPDEVVLQLGVETIRTDLDDARRENDKRVAAVLSLLKSSGIDEKHIQTDHVRVEPLYTYKGDRDRALRGFNIRKDMTVTLRDLTKMETITTDLLKAGTTNIYNYTLRSTQVRAQRDEARLMAIKAAREKAEAAAAALGQKIGPPLRITEVPLMDVYSTRTANVSTEMQGSVGDGMAQTFAHGRVTISARVKIAFALQ